MNERNVFNQNVIINHLNIIEALICAGIEPLDSTLVEDKAEAPGEAPDPQTAGLSGARPLGLGVAVLPPLPPDVASNQFTPSNMAHKKRTSPLPTPPPPPPPRLDPEVNTFHTKHMGCFPTFHLYCTQCIMLLPLSFCVGVYFLASDVTSIMYRCVARLVKK